MNRTQAPEFKQPSELKIQFPKVIELHNGIQLFWSDEVKDDAVKLDIEWEAGSKYQRKKLVASFTNKLLLAGSKDKGAKEIAAEMDYFGGYFQRELDRDHAGITLYGLTENMGKLFSIFSDAFEKAEFPQTEFEKERSVTLAQFKIDSKKVKNKCRRAFNKAVFGEKSDYGLVAKETDFDLVERTDLVNYFDLFYKKKKPIIFLVGAVSDGFVEQLREWSKQFSQTDKEPYSQSFNQEKGRVNVPVEKAIQAAIRIGRIMFDKKHDDYFGFQLLNTLLGGYFGSRLMMNIREDKGYTYGIGSGMSVMEDSAYFYISTEDAVEVKEATIEEIFKELKKLREELIDENELVKVKNYMLGDFLRSSDGAIAMMENFKNIHFNQLKETYYTDFIQAINSITAKELQLLAQKYLQKEDLITVVAG